jgi:branched-chain amino acid transport system substrate-binding protein
MPYGRSVLTLACAATAVLVLSPPAAAQTVVKIGNISSYSGFVAQAADQAQKAVDLYVKEHEKELPPGIKLEIMRRDDTSNPEVGKRLAQELITREHVQLLTGVILSPVAAAIAPLTAEAKVPLLISIAAGGSAIPRISPYVARVSFTLWQQGYPIGKWAAEQGWKKGYTAVSDFIPGHDSEASFAKGFTDGGGQIVGAVRIPPNNPDFAPFVQRIKDAKPDVVFFWIPSTQATALVNAVRDLGLREAGIQITSAQDLLPDEQLPAMGDSPLGLITPAIIRPPANVRQTRPSLLPGSVNMPTPLSPTSCPSMPGTGWSRFSIWSRRRRESLRRMKRWRSSRGGRTRTARVGRS